MPVRATSVLPWLPLACAALAAGSGAGHAGPLPGASSAVDPPCRLLAPRVVRLESDEFKIISYDAANGRVAVVPPNELAPNAQRTARLQFRWPGNTAVLLPMPPETFSEIVNARSVGQLHLTMQLEPLWEDADGPRAACEHDAFEVKATHVELSIENVTVAERDLDIALDPVRVRQSMVEIGEITSERRCMHVDPQPLLAPIRHIGEQCLIEGLRTLPSIQGSISLELHRTPVGEKQAPEVVIDSLVSPAVEHCLLREIQAADAAIWEQLPAGARIYVPFYFRDAPPDGWVGPPVAPGPDPSETKAP